MNIGLLIIATGRYKSFLPNLIRSADEYFMTNHNVTYFIFSDEVNDFETDREYSNIIIEHKSWPYPTLLRFQNFSDNYMNFEGMDYLYYVDADMIFENMVGDEILSDIVSVVHPWFVNDRGTPEDRNSSSCAYIPPSVNYQYTAGAFFGGKYENILNMFHFLAEQIRIDLSKDIIARFHDESHSNKFFIMYSTKLLSPEYCYNKSSIQCTNNPNWIPRVVQVNKNESQIRD